MLLKFYLLKISRKGVKINKTYSLVLILQIFVEYPHLIFGARHTLMNTVGVKSDALVAYFCRRLNVMGPHSSCVCFFGVYLETLFWKITELIGGKASMEGMVH